MTKIEDIWEWECKSNLATEKQLKYINIICSCLKIDKPINPTKQEAFLFIQKHESDYKSRVRRNWAIICMLERKIKQEKKRDYSTENSFEGPHGTDLIDCYDYGIYPWGDS